MEALYQDYKDEDVVIIGLDIQETREEVSQYVQQGGYSWLFILDTSGKVATNYEVTAIPTSFFIDGDGIIRAVSTGAMSKRDMEIALTKAMR
jgi:alkyl hydroperoxide reductase subunit AhpC|tara:strand:+ start:97 stop:372 length:276 start_codon:yes stop_codon:yes gene_type:complete